MAADKAEKEKAPSASETSAPATSTASPGAEPSVAPAEAPKAPATVAAKPPTEAAKVPPVAVKTPTVSDVKISGRAGGPFNIVGENFGDKGMVRVSGRVVATTAWVANRIKGQLPSDLPPGEVEVHTVDGRVLTGEFK